MLSKPQATGVQALSYPSASPWLVLTGWATSSPPPESCGQSPLVPGPLSASPHTKSTAEPVTNMINKLKDHCERPQMQKCKASYTVSSRSAQAT